LDAFRSSGGNDACAQQSGALSQDRKTGSVAIKITDLKCAVIGNNQWCALLPIRRDGYGQAESSKNYSEADGAVLQAILIAKTRPTLPSSCFKIRRMGGFKPWGAAVSAIEIACWILRAR